MICQMTHSNEGLRTLPPPGLALPSVLKTSGTSVSQNEQGHFLHTAASSVPEVLGGAKGRKWALAETWQCAEPYLGSSTLSWDIPPHALDEPLRELPSPRWG